MSRLFLFSLLFFICFNVHAEVTISPSEVYGQLLLIEQETNLVKRHFHVVNQPAPVAEIVFDAQPRHVWQKAYMLQMKLVAFRRKQHLDGITPVLIEPKEQLDPRYTWAQMERILTEIRIIRKVLGIPGTIGAASSVKDKKPLDVFNKLAQLEADWDVLTGAGFDASHAFAQTLRLNEDVDMLLQQLGVFDSAVPPAKQPADTPKEALAEAFLVLAQVQRLQRLAGLNGMDLTAFRKTENVTASDVFNMVCLILAEVQQIKAHIGLIHAITPSATYQEGKKPADVRQLLSYITHKLALIEHL